MIDQDVADVNRKKINSLISSIGIQIVVFIVVVYSTIYSNALAYDLLNIYTWLIGAIAVFYSGIIMMSDKSMIKSGQRDALEAQTTPTAIVRQMIGLLFSIIEISLFIRYNMPVIAVVWIAGEISQLFMIVRAKRFLINNKVEGIVEGTVEGTITIGDRTFVIVSTPTFIKELRDLQTILDALDTQIDACADKEEQNRLSLLRRDSHDKLIKILHIANDTGLIVGIK